MTAELRLDYHPDGDGTGQLSAVVTSGAFSGAGSAWFDRESLRGTVKALREYPIPQGGRPEISGGFWSKAHRGTLEQCHLRIAVRPYDLRGNLLVQVDLSTPSESDPNSDRQQSVTVRFLTEYGALGVFATELEQVLDRERETAILKGTAG